MDLAQKHCVPCEGGMPPFTQEEIEAHAGQVPEWKVSEGEPKKLERKFTFKDFDQTMEFVNKVAALAKAEDHHPDFQVSYSKVTLTLWTHAVKGLSENDFIMAAKIDRL